jgi:hypothetical protein
MLTTWQGMDITWRSASHESGSPTVSDLLAGRSTPLGMLGATTQHEQRAALTASMVKALDRGLRCSRTRFPWSESHPLHTGHSICRQHSKAGAPGQRHCQPPVYATSHSPVARIGQFSVQRYCSCPNATERLQQATPSRPATQGQRTAGVRSLLPSRRK